MDRIPSPQAPPPSEGDLDGGVHNAPIHVKFSFNSLMLSVILLSVSKQRPSLKVTTFSRFKTQQRNPGCGGRDPRSCQADALHRRGSGRVDGRESGQCHGKRLQHTSEDVGQGKMAHMA